MPVLSTLIPIGLLLLLSFSAEREGKENNPLDSNERNWHTNCRKKISIYPFFFFCMNCVNKIVLDDDENCWHKNEHGRKIIIFKA